MNKGNLPLLGRPFVDNTAQLTIESFNILDSMSKRQQGDIYITSGAPDASLGENGDWAIDLVGLKFYQKTTVWDAGTALGNVSATAVKLTRPIN